MTPFCRITLGSPFFTTNCSTGNQPKWNEEFTFSEMPQEMLYIAVCHKGMLFGQTEVGRCTIKLPNKPMECNKTFLLSSGKESAGTILLGIKLFEQIVANYMEEKSQNVSRNGSEYEPYLKDTEMEDEIAKIKRRVAEQNDCIV